MSALEMLGGLALVILVGLVVVVGHAFGVVKITAEWDDDKP